MSDTLEVGRLYWVRVPEWSGSADDWRESMSDWQPARYDGGRWILLGDNDVYADDRGIFDRVVVHPIPMEPPT